MTLQHAQRATSARSSSLPCSQCVLLILAPPCDALGYERMWPLAAGGVMTQQNYNSPKGIVHIVNGAAGNVEGLSEQQPHTQLRIGASLLHVQLAHVFICVSVFFVFPSPAVPPARLLNLTPRPSIPLTLVSAS